jgi:hypothetical protein
VCVLLNFFGVCSYSLCNSSCFIFLSLEARTKANFTVPTTIETSGLKRPRRPPLALSAEAPFSSPIIRGRDILALQEFLVIQPLCTHKQTNKHLHRKTHSTIIILQLTFLVWRRIVFEQLLTKIVRFLFWTIDAAKYNWQSNRFCRSSSYFLVWESDEKYFQTWKQQQQQQQQRWKWSNGDNVPVYTVWRLSFSLTFLLTT